MNSLETVTESRTSTAIVLAKALVVPKISLQGWADQITDASGEAVEKILVIGRLFLAAKKALRHGQWGRLFAGHKHAVAHPVRYTVTVARMYMKIAEHPILSNRNLGSDLPPSMSALYQLYLIREPMLSRLIAAGCITPNLTKAHAMALRVIISSSLPYRMQLQIPGKPVINRQRSYAAIVESLLNAQAMLFRYGTQVSEEIQSGVVWVPPFTQPMSITAKPIIKAMHRCECGDIHEDQR